MAFTIGVDTIVDATNSFWLSFPSFFHWVIRKWVISTIAWFPFRMVMLPSASRTAMPKRSQSGSVPITISAFSLFAKSMAICSASGSSGLGETTVGKSPSGFAWASTTVTLVYPAISSTFGTMVIAVP